jgi:hypothetical protein
MCEARGFAGAPHIVHSTWTIATRLPGAALGHEDQAQTVPIGSGILRLDMILHCR